MHPLEHGKFLRSPGGSFVYRIQGPCCRLYDREELPWPSCSLAWKGKQPSWNRIGRRFVPDMAASKCPSYSVSAADLFGNTWTEVITIYYHNMTRHEKAWWYSKVPKDKPFPENPNEQ